MKPPMTESFQCSYDVPVLYDMMDYRFTFINKTRFTYKHDRSKMLCTSLDSLKPTVHIFFVISYRVQKPTDTHTQRQ